MNPPSKDNFIPQGWLQDHGHVIRILALAAVYFEIARFGFTFAPGEQVTVIWPAAGFSLASILLFGYRVWPGIFLGSFLSKMSVHLSVMTGLGIAAGNTLEPLIGAGLLHYYVGGNHYLERLKGIFGLWFFSTFISTAICAVIGVTTLYLSGLQSWATSGAAFLTWWLADAGGSLIVAPVLLAWGHGPYTPPPLRTMVEAAALFAVAAAGGVIIFIHPSSMGAVWVYPYMVFPLLTWAAIRFRQRTVTVVIMAVCGITLWVATRHIGLFAQNTGILASLPMEQALIVVQTYTMVVAMIGLTIHAAISELREAERESHENLERLQDILDNIPDPVLLRDRQHVLIGGNKALWAMLKGTSEQFIGGNCRELFLKEEEAEAFNQRYEEVFKTGKPSISEETFTGLDGKRHILAFNIGLLRSKKAGPSLVAVARDITPLRETENLLRKYTQDLENRNRELDDFTYVASHDMKEPLRGMNIIASLLLEDYAGKLDAEITNRLWRLAFLSRHMTKLVNDLLRFSRLGRSEPVLHETDPNQIIADIQKTLAPLLKEKNALIAVPHALPRLVCDKAGLEEILRSLITNAVKYNDAENKVVEAGMLDSLVSPRGPEKNVFYVRDNGIGIDPVYHQIIFRIFKRLPGSIGYDPSGTGMGLTFVKKIVERNNGFIWLESVPDEGTTFYFTLGR